MRFGSFALVVAIAFNESALFAKDRSADVVVYGATPGGIVAAISAATEKSTVVLVSPSNHIGGLLTGGLSVTDCARQDLVGGLSAKFFYDVHKELGDAAYQKERFIDFHGQPFKWKEENRWDVTPAAASRVFKRWIDQAGFPLIHAKLVGVTMADGRIVEIELTDGSKVHGKVFIDASYEGDLLAKAGIPYSYGREAAAEFNEDQAGTRKFHFKKNYSEEEYRTPTWTYMHHGQWGADIPARDSSGKLYWGISDAPLAPLGTADKRIQAYCFRVPVTQRKDILVPWPKPAVYEPNRYELLLKYIEAHPGVVFTRLLHMGAIPDGKFDMNASGPFSTDYVNGNLGYPDADEASRQAMFDDHVNYQQGFLWFLAHDPRVPKRLQAEVNTWGLCKDEFVDHGHWPPQMYIREARRLKGEYVMTQNDVLKDRFKDDSIATGNFVLDSHWVQRLVDEKGNVRVEGHLDESIPVYKFPYDIPYRSITPKAADCRNLLVPVCISATHVAICTIRMEPVYMIMGEAAGIAASMAAKSDGSVQDVDFSSLRNRLLEKKQILSVPRTTAK